MKEFKVHDRVRILKGKIEGGVGRITLLIHGVDKNKGKIFYRVMFKNSPFPYDYSADQLELIPEFKIRDEVETYHQKGEIYKIKDGLFHIKFYDGPLGVRADHELKLLTKLKILAQLWEEGGRQNIQVKHASGCRYTMFGHIAFKAYLQDENGCNSQWPFDQADWQLYQKPEDEEECAHEHANQDPDDGVIYCYACGNYLDKEPEEKHFGLTDKEMDIMTGAMVSGDLKSIEEMAQRRQEEKPAEKCVHKNKHTLDLYKGTYQCNDCKVNLVYKYLWYVNHTDNDEADWRLLTKPRTEEEAKEYGVDYSVHVKKATNSRELFKVGK